MNKIRKINTTATYKQNKMSSYLDLFSLLQIPQILFENQGVTTIIEFLS